MHCAEGDRSSIPFVTHACSTRARGTCGSTRSTRDGLDRKRAAGFTAEAGKTYYFRTKTPQQPNSSEQIRLVPVDPAEAQVLIAATAFSTFSLKK